jgi:ABC-type amino acid transport system permease subunit
MGFSMGEIFLNWTVISAVVTGLIGVGVGVMRTSPPEFIAAKWCFSVAYLILLLRLSWWMFIDQTRGMPNLSAIQIFLIFGFIGVLWGGAMMWVENKQKAHAPLRGQRKITEPKSRPLT